MIVQIMALHCHHLENVGDNWVIISHYSHAVANYCMADEMATTPSGLLYS